MQRLLRTVHTLCDRLSWLEPVLSDPDNLVQLATIGHPWAYALLALAVAWLSRRE